MNRKQNYGMGAGLLLLAFVSLGFASGNNSLVKAEWQLAKSSKEIALFYRWVELENNTEIREMKAEFTIEAEISTILQQFLSEESYMKWAAGIKHCNIDLYNDSLWYTHTVMNYPFPFRKKDLITKHLVEHNNESTSILIEAAPDFKAETSGIERMKNYYGSWNFIDKGNGITNVDYRMLSYEKPVLPRVVQDPVIQRISINSFAELKKMAEKK